MAGHDKEVREAIVVQIDHSRTPTHESIVDGETGLSCYVVKICPAGVPIEIWNVIREVRFENVEVAVEVVVSHG